MNPAMTDEALLALIAHWEALADQAREQTRVMSAGDVSRATFYEGVMKTYQSAARDLRDLIAPPQTEITDAPAGYQVIPPEEAAALLQRAGLFARSLTHHPDHVFTAVFSRLQPITQDSRIRQLSAADPRIVIVDHGTLRDSGDPYIDFAFS
jgi:hypothetical protein